MEVQLNLAHWTVTVLGDDKVGDILNFWIICVLKQLHPCHDRPVSQINLISVKQCSIFLELIRKRLVGKQRFGFAKQLCGLLDLPVKPCAVAGIQIVGSLWFIQA